MCEAKGELSEGCAMQVGVGQGCVVSPWLFDIFIDGCMREVKAKDRNVGAKVSLNGVGWPVVA